MKLAVTGLLYGNGLCASFGYTTDRLQLDHELVAMRTRYEAEKEAVRQHIIRTFHVQPPSAP